MKVRLLLEADIRELLSFEEAIIAAEKSFAAFNSGQAILPGIINLDLPEVQGEVHVKAAYIKGEENYVVKIASGFYLNPSLGLPVGDGLILLFSAPTGRLTAILFDRGYITEMRTAAAGAVAAKYLARSRIKRVALIGSGTQARYQLRALAVVREFEEVAVWSRNPANVENYIRDMKYHFPGVNFYAPRSAEEAVRSAEIIITATPSRFPIIQAKWLSPGAHITAIGSDGPEKQELFPDVLSQADLLYADSLAQCRRLGEIHHGLEAGTIDEKQVTGEIGEIILGKKPGRTEENQITVADLTGLGVQDATAAVHVLQQAEAQNLGTYLNI